MARQGLQDAWFSLGDTLAQCGDICNAGNAYLNAASAGDVQAVSSAEECFGLGHVIALEHDHRDAAATAQAGLANCQKMRSNLGMVQTESVKAPTLSSVAEEEKPADKPCPWNVKTTLGRRCSAVKTQRYNLNGRRLPRRLSWGGGVLRSATEPPSRRVCF